MKKVFIRKINKRGKYSYFISIPKELMREFSWRERQKLKIIPRPRKKSIEIKDWSR